MDRVSMSSLQTTYSEEFSSRGHPAYLRRFINMMSLGKHPYECRDFGESILPRLVGFSKDGLRAVVEAFRDIGGV